MRWCNIFRFVRIILAAPTCVILKQCSFSLSLFCATSSCRVDYIILPYSLSKSASTPVCIIHRDEFSFSPKWRPLGYVAVIHYLALTDPEKEKKKSQSNQGFYPSRNVMKLVKYAVPNSCLKNKSGILVNWNSSDRTLDLHGKAGPSTRSKLENPSAFSSQRVYRYFSFRL